MADYEDVVEWLHALPEGCELRAELLHIVLQLTELLIHLILALLDLARAIGPRLRRQP